MKFFNKHIFATTITINLLFVQTIFAIEEVPATPSVISEPAAKLLITEINFKNKEKDFAVFTYTSPSQKPTNLKNIKIKDDGVIKTIEEDFFIASGQQILLTWNTDQTDSAPYLYTARKGLTGTTEQLIIYDQNDKILDMVCWTTESPTEAEIKDFETAFENEGWAASSINSCINSEIINNNESIFRKENTDTNSSADWILPSQPEPEITTKENAEIKITALNTPQTTTLPTEEIIKEIIINPELVSIEIPETDIAASTQKSSNSKKTSSYSNGNLSNNIIISEILPNPEGSDSGKEWIELFNNGTNDINLGNWILDDAEEGSKPFTLPDSITIKSGQTILIDCKTAKLSLGNAEDSVRLFDFNNELITETQYENAPSNESYSLITIIDEDDETTNEYQWTNAQTPGQPNPSYYKFTISVNAEPVFSDQYFFTGTTSSNKNLKIIFTEDIIAAPLAKATFTKESMLNLIVKEIDDEEFLLISYETIGTNKINSSPSGLLLPIFLGFLTIAGISLYFATKKIHWQLDKKSL